MSKIDSVDFKNKHVIVRVDFNVPLNEKFEVTDDTRIKAALPTIKKILHDRGKVILMSHLGRPKNGPEEKFSLKHLVPNLSRYLNRDIKFSNDCIGQDALKVSQQLQPEEVLLLENLRFYSEETKGDTTFAEKLSQHADVYINDAFGTAHRAHASTAIIADFFDAKNKMFGFLMEKEIENANKVLKESQKPFTAIMGGAKISDKILIIEKLLDIADNIIIGGGMSYTFFKAQGGKVGNSLVEEDKLDLVLSLLDKAKQKGVKILLPEDSVIADSFSNEANTDAATNNNIPDGWMGLDIGPKAIESYKETIRTSQTILWNGPMGVFEMEKFSKGTETIAKTVAEATRNGAFSLVGGGDSVAAINKFSLTNEVSYVSTGGGAMLEYFEGKQLPGIAAIIH